MRQRTGVPVVRQPDQPDDLVLPHLLKGSGGRYTKVSWFALTLYLEHGLRGGEHGRSTSSAGRLHATVGGETAL